MSNSIWPINYDHTSDICRESGFPSGKATKSIILVSVLTVGSDLSWAVKVLT